MAQTLVEAFEVWQRVESSTTYGFVKKRARRAFVERLRVQDEANAEAARDLGPEDDDYFEQEGRKCQAWLAEHARGGRVPFETTHDKMVRNRRELEEEFGDALEPPVGVR